MRTTTELLQALDEMAAEFSAVDVAADIAAALVVARTPAQNLTAKALIREWQATTILAAPFVQPDRLEVLNGELAAGGIPLGHVLIIREWMTAEDYRYRSGIQLLPEICEPDFDEAWATEFLKKCCVEVRNRLVEITGATVIDHKSGDAA